MLTLNNHFICSSVTIILSACLGTRHASQSANSYLNIPFHHSYKSVLVGQQKAENTSINSSSGVLVGQQKAENTSI